MVIPENPQFATVKSEGETTDRTVLAFRRLQEGYIGKVITVERGFYRIYTEEEHHPHCVPPDRRYGTTEEVTLTLQGAGLKALSGITQEGEMRVIPYERGAINDSWGSYRLQLITKIISSEGQLLFETRVRQDERSGFTGIFYFWLEAYKPESVK